MCQDFFVRLPALGPAFEDAIETDAVGPLKFFVSSTVAARRFILILLSIFAATAVLLAMTGVYAVMS